MEKYYSMPIIPAMTTREAVVCEYVGKIYDTMNEITRIQSKNQRVGIMNDIYYKLYMTLGSENWSDVLAKLTHVGKLMQKLKDDELLEKNALTIVAKTKKRHLIFNWLNKRKIEEEDMILAKIQSMIDTKDVLIQTVEFIKENSVQQ